MTMDPVADAIAVYEQMANDARTTPTLIYIDRYGQERPHE